MKNWQMGLVGAALVGVMTACPAPNRSGAGDARTVFPIKSGAEWDVSFFDGKELLRKIGFALDGNPEYDDDGDVYADFRTTNNATASYGWAYPQTGRFQASVVIDSAKKLKVNCYADNTPNLNSNVSGALMENNKEVGKVPCAFTRR